MKKKQHIIVGLTGNIGAGKSYIAHIIKSLGYPVFDSDLVSKNLLNEPPVKEEIRSIFSTKVFDNVDINRKKLAELVFSDPVLLQKLNGILHPQVGKRFQEWVETQSSGILVKESAILVEHDLYQRLDELIVVTCPEQLRIERTVKRDVVKKEEVVLRIKNQLPESEKVKVASFVINNDDKHLVVPQVVEVIEKIKKKHENS